MSSPPDLDYYQEVAGCKALLLEVIRRAISDWVLYRDSPRLKLKKIAQEAHLWLFVEKPGHPDWVQREKTGTQFTSFLGICEILEIDPELVRTRAKATTIQDILSVGRPPSYRKAQSEEDDAESEEAFDLGGLRSKVDELMAPEDDRRWLGRWDNSGNFGGKDSEGGNYE